MNGKTDKSVEYSTYQGFLYHTSITFLGLTNPSDLSNLVFNAGTAACDRPVDGKTADVMVSRPKWAALAGTAKPSTHHKQLINPRLLGMKDQVAQELPVQLTGTRWQRSVECCLPDLH